MGRLGNFACGEHDHRLARQKGLVDFFHGLFGMAVVDANHSQALQDCPQVPPFKVVLVACNAERSGTCHLEHGPVDKAMVGTHHEHRARIGNVAHVQHANFVAAEHQAQKGAEQSLGQIRDGPGEHAQGNQAKSHKVELRTDMGVMHHHRIKHQENTQNNSLNQVRKGNDPAGVIGAGIVLQEGVHRHQEHATKEAHQYINHGKGHRVHHKGNQEHAKGGPNHAQGDKARLDKVLGVPGRKDGAHHQAPDGKGQVVLDHVHRLGTGYILEQKGEHLGHGPEHGEGDYGGAQRTLAPAQAKPASGGGKTNAGVGILDLRDQETRHGTKHAHPHQNPGNHH